MKPRIAIALLAVFTASASGFGQDGAAAAPAQAGQPASAREVTAAKSKSERAVQQTAANEAQREAKAATKAEEKATKKAEKDAKKAAKKAKKDAEKAAKKEAGKKGGKSGKPG